MHGKTETVEKNGLKINILRAADWLAQNGV